jgi:RecA-family ATPase
MGQGGALCGLRVRPAKVLVVSEEDQSLWVRRRDRLGIGSHVHVMVRPLPRTNDHARWQRFLRHLAAEVKRHGIGLVVFDCLSNVWPVADENDAALVAAALDPVRRLLVGETGAAVLLVHHARKADGSEGVSARGSGALAAFVDTLVELRRHDPRSYSDRRRVLSGLGRYEETPAEIVMELSADGKEYVRVGSKAESIVSDKQRRQAREDRADDARVLAAVDALTERHGHATWNKAMIRSRIGKPRMERAVMRLTEDEVLEEAEAEVQVGNGARRTARVLRRTCRHADGMHVPDSSA